MIEQQLPLGVARQQVLLPIVIQIQQAGAGPPGGDREIDAAVLGVLDRPEVGLAVGSFVEVDPHFAVEGPDNEIFPSVTVPVHGRGRRACCDIDVRLHARLADLHVRSGVECRRCIGAGVGEEANFPRCLAGEQVLARVGVPVDDAREDAEAAAGGDGQVRARRLGEGIARKGRLGAGTDIQIDAHFPLERDPATLSDEEVLQTIAVPIDPGGYGIAGHRDIDAVGLDRLRGPELKRGGSGGRDRENRHDDQGNKRCRSCASHGCLLVAPIIVAKTGAHVIRPLA